MTEEAPLLEVRDLRLTLNLRRGDARAVDGVSLTIAAGETLGVVGEFGLGQDDDRPCHDEAAADARAHHARGQRQA